LISLDNHHIWSKCYGGPNVDWNRCTICPNCHRKVHSGDIIIEGNFASTSTLGSTLIYRKKGDSSITEEKDPKVWINIKEEIC